jgi:ABC-type sugar transport system ATPase subunit
MIYVTHDQTEAMTMGGRIVVMNAGRIQQVAPPLEVYERPANPFVAGFIGTPPMNLFPPGTLDATRRMGLRPEYLRVAAAGEGLPARVDFVELLGSETLVHVLLEAGEVPVIARVPGFATYRAGERVVLVPERAHAVVFEP